MKINEIKIYPYGSSPLRNQKDYGEKTASAKYKIPYFSNNINYFIEKLQDFNYGCKYTNGSIITNLDDINKRKGENIYIQSPKEFYKNKIGMCHDASIFIDHILTKEHIQHKCFYIYSDEPPFYPTHSFVVAKCNDNYLRIIDVFATKSCMYKNKFLNYNEAALKRFKRWIILDNNKKDNAHLLYNEHISFYDCDFIKFSDYILNNFIEL